MTVQCPHCATGYLLPEHLLGPRGARVRCPSCGQTFVVTRESAAPPQEPEPAGAVETPAMTEPELDAESLAADLVAELASRLGPRLETARRGGRVLAEIGPDMIAAFDEYRRRAGEGASAEVFRRVLRERLGVSLEGRDG